MAVTLVTEDQVQNDSGDLIDVYDVTFTAGPNNTKFVVQVPQAGDAVAAVAAAIAAKESAVTGIYAL